MQSGAWVNSLRYRADVDGLRAIAVLLVIGFHAFPKLVPGGYVGVDIFFVISGFLITGLLLHDLESKQFSFAGFYARRIRRIFPALFIVLAACFAAGWILLLPQQFSSLGLNIFGGAAFTSNFIQFGQTGYFDVSAAQKPLLHLWSLGVEEQFYIVWPILMLLAFSRRLSMIVVLLGLLVISFVWNVASAGSSADFYLPLTRAWELMVGAAIAAFASQSEKVRWPKLFGKLGSLLHEPLAVPLANVWSQRNLWAALGVSLIAIAVVSLSRESPFPGYWALLPTAGTALIILAEGAWLNRVLLANPASVCVGLISYPLYLWHWPLLSFAAIVDPSGFSASVRSAAIALAAAFAWLTFQFVERPIRTGRRRSLKVACLCVAIAAIGAVGWTTYYMNGFVFRIPAALRNVTEIPLDRVAEWRLGTCFLDQVDGTPDEHFVADCIERDRRPLVFLWGDSFAAALYPGLKRLQQARNFGIAQFNSAGCPPLIDFAPRGRPHCLENQHTAFSMLMKTKPEIVLLYSAWNYGNIYSHLESLISELRALKVPRIIVMGPPPQWAGGLPKAALDFYTKDPLHRMLPLYSDFRLHQYVEKYQSQFEEFVKHLGVEYISTWDALCRKDECRAWVDAPGDQLMVFDEAHLTIPGSSYLARAISPCLFPEQGDRPTFCTATSSTRTPQARLPAILQPR